MPKIELQGFSYKIFNAFVEILNGSKTSLNNWSKDELHELLRCFDMSRNLEDFLPKLETLLLEECSIHPENTLSFYEFAKEIEIFPGLEKACSLRIMGQLNGDFKNMYLISVQQKYPQLRALCLNFISNNLKLNDKDAFHGAASGVISECDFLEKEDAKSICYDYLLAQLPLWMKQARYKWDADLNKFVTTEKSTDKLVSSLKSIVSKKEDNNSLLEKLNEFNAIAQGIKAIRVPCLKDLSEENLEWLLSRISKDTIELNLDSVKTFNIGQINRFVNLEILSLGQSLQIKSLDCLSALRNLRNLDLNHCYALVSLDFLPHFTKLEVLNLEDDTYIRDCAPLLDVPSLKSVNVMGCNDKFQQILRGQTKKMKFNLISDHPGN